MKKICKTYEELICENCIHSRDMGDHTYVTCLYKQASYGKRVLRLSFCGEKGEWAVPTRTADWHLDPNNTEEHKRIVDKLNNGIRTLTRDFAVQVILNEGIYDW